MISINSGTTFQVSTVERSKEPLPTTSYEASFRNVLNKNVVRCVQYLEKELQYVEKELQNLEKIKEQTSWLTERPRWLAEERLLLTEQLHNLSLQERQIEACSKSEKALVAGILLHPFLAAVHIAFAQHYPLVLSPDAVWLCLIQGLALHVNANAEQLRHHFVQHEGRKKITIRRDDFIKGSPDNPWTEVFDTFSTAIKNYIGDKYELIVSDFSTTGVVERAVSEIVLMESVQQYFEYSVGSFCGIPEITLEGTVEDWKAIRQRVEKFTEFHLEWWTKPLIPILDQFVAAASGDVDRDFWQSFYKKGGGSGGPYTTGWINVLFPYIENWETYIENWETNTYISQNPYVNSWSTAMGDMDDMDGRIGRGPTTNSFPVGLSKVPFKWEFPLENLVFDMEFIGGFVGVSQEQQTLAVRPELGWAVLEGNK
jgi:hypothetical protein